MKFENKKFSFESKRREKQSNEKKDNLQFRSTVTVAVDGNDILLFDA